MNREVLLTAMAKKQPIRLLKDTPFLFMPLSTYRGHFARPVVHKGDRVLKYQLIAAMDDAFSSNIHAPVSGQIVDVREVSGQDGEKQSMLVLENDFRNESVNRQAAQHVEWTPETILQTLEDAGVVGAGGAQFPTALKYRLAGDKVRTFIVNGVECEPYLTADYAVMHERTEAFFEGIRLLNKLLKPEEVVIAIEEKNRDLEAVFAPYLEQSRHAECRVQVVSGGYPEGSQWQLVCAVTGLELTLPRQLTDEGIVVSNAGTVYAAYRALADRVPVVSRILTVSGEGIQHPCNVDVSIGTPVGTLLEQLEITPDRHVIVLGGPMMGRAITDWSSPVTKGTNGVLVLERQTIRRENCISCGHCIDVCPMRLMPLKYAEGWRKGKLAMMKRYDLNLCVQCGACESVCPAGVPLMASIRNGKARLRSGEQS